MRFWVVRPYSNYLIVYDPQKKPLQIIRILHGARDLSVRLASVGGKCSCSVSGFYFPSARQTSRNLLTQLWSTAGGRGSRLEYSSGSSPCIATATD